MTRTAAWWQHEGALVLGVVLMTVGGEIWSAPDHIWWRDLAGWALFTVGLLLIVDDLVTGRLDGLALRGLTHSHPTKIVPAARVGREGASPMTEQNTPAEGTPVAETTVTTHAPQAQQSETGAEGVTVQSQAGIEQADAARLNDANTGDGGDAKQG